MYLDIESSFILAGVWGLWNNNVSLNQMLTTGQLLSWSAKWKGAKSPMESKWWDEWDFLERMHALLSEADVVVSYNGKRFDIPMLNREFVKAGYKPPAPFKQIDLLETVKKQFRLPSNKLEFVLKDLGVGAKMKHEGFPLWIKCMQGDEKAKEKMLKYNRKDVSELEKLHKRLDGWVVGTPNAALYMDKIPNSPVCTACGSVHLQKRGYAYTNTGKFQKLSCNDCGHWSRARYSEVVKEDRTNILMNIAQ